MKGRSTVFTKPCKIRDKIAFYLAFIIIKCNTSFVDIQSHALYVRKLLNKNTNYFFLLKI